MRASSRSGSRAVSERASKTWLKSKNPLSEAVRWEREEKWGYAQEDRAFVDSIVNGTPPLVTAYDGLMSVEIANAVYESVRSGQAIQIRVLS